MLDRRQFLKIGGVAVAGFIAPQPARTAFARSGCAPLKKYVDPLPRPGVLSPARYMGSTPWYDVPMTQFSQQLHRDLPPTVVWGYNGQYPGKTIEARSGAPILVSWINNLPNEHLLPIDHTLHGAEPDVPDVRTIVHVHGGHVPPESDGFPDLAFPPGESATFLYPNSQRASTLWYHDHAIGITRLNVYAGLAAFYLLRDSVEDSLNLPSGGYEIPIAIQDRILDPDGRLIYPVSGDPEAPWIPEFFGDVIVVNGKVWPFLEVEPRKYRFRLLNGSNARFYNLKLQAGLVFYQIGNEGGLLPAPVVLDEILLAPAERADVIIDFSGHTAKRIVLRNTAPDGPFPGVLQPNNAADPNTTGQILEFRVQHSLSCPDTSSAPAALPPVPVLDPNAAVRVRDLPLMEIPDPNVPGRVMLILNDRRWSDPITETPQRGTIEIWRLINTTMDTHPIHLHLVHFQILGRTPFAVEQYLADADAGPPLPVELYFTGPTEPPDENERGFKDTVRANPGEVTSIIAYFDDFTGVYPWHCHILEHEDNEMMRPYEVVSGP